MFPQMKRVILAKSIRQEGRLRYEKFKTERTSSTSQFIISRSRPNINYHETYNLFPIH